VAPIPQPEGVPPRAYSPSVVLDAIPIGSRRVEEAFTFLRWYYSPRSDGRPSPASDYCYNIHNIPTRKGEASQDRFINNPKFKMFVDEMLTKEAIYFPPVPVGRFFQDQVNVAREYVIFGEKTPAQALRELQLKTNDEWRRIAGPAEEGGT
jgi:ABC-type glycerol-3-phosphate transport system substrate-binding protein